MDTNFNAALYQEEMLSLVNTAIKKLKAEHPDYTVFTISLTTDFASGVSAVHFDSRASSERYLKNEAEQYQKYLQAGNLSMAEMYAPTGEIRITNPADFELPFYAEIQNESFSLNFEEEQEDEDSELEDEASCVYWEEATPILKQVAAVAYRTAKSELNVDTEALEEYGQRHRNCNLEDMDMDSLRRVSDALGIPTGEPLAPVLERFRKATQREPLYQCIFHEDDGSLTESYGLMFE